MHGHQFFSEQDDQDKASRVAASNPHICDPGCSANLDVRDKNFSSVIMHGKGNTLLARAGEEGLKMFFVGEVVVTPTDGSKIRGLRAPAGKILVDGREVFMHVVPHPAFADLKGAMCIPAWSVTVASKEERVTMKLQTMDISIPTRACMGTEGKDVKFRLHYLQVAKPEPAPGDDGYDDDSKDSKALKELQRERFQWEEVKWQEKLEQAQQAKEDRGSAKAGSTTGARGKYEVQLNTLEVTHLMM